MDNAQPPTDTEPTSSELFQRISQYPFAADNEWLIGLSTILGHPDTPPTPEELSSQSDLILQAQCFYLARKFNLPPIDVAAYKAFSQDSAPSPPPRPSAPTPATAAADTVPQSAGSAEPVPPYPTSFAEIVDLITQNKPIPGIEEVPATVLEHGSSKQDHAARRRKPWEKDDAESETADVDPEAPRSGVGVMKILQPNAVPDSGLIAKE